VARTELVASQEGLCCKELVAVSKAARLTLGTWHLAPNGAVRSSLYVSIWHTADGRSAVPLADFGAGRSWVVEAKPTNILLLTLRGMRWASHVARMGRMEVYTGKSEEKNRLEVLGSFGE
jgi:hypothetical protein